MEREDFFEHYSFDVDSKQSSLRIDKYLFEKMHRISRNKIQESIQAGFILVNKKRIKARYKVQPEDHIKVYLPSPPEPSTLKPELISFGIIYEDEALIIVNKPAALVVHPAHGNWTGTLLNGLMHHFGSQNLKPYLVHRMDKDTSGLLVVAKSEDAGAGLSKQFFDHSISRVYHALVWGAPHPHKGTIDAPIGRHPKDRRLFTVRTEGGKEARTHYEMLDSWGEVSLLACTLETGRTHQIRVHMQHLGHPVFGDKSYGGDHIRKGLVTSSYKQFIHNCFMRLPRQGLHACSLGFVHPSTEAYMQFEAAYPEDMQAVLDKWKTYRPHRENQPSDTG